MSQYDFTVVGAGIAGQLLARELARLGQRVQVVHDPSKRGASDVAAWMINPITGIRFVASWRVDAYLPIAIASFQEIAAESGLEIWHPLPIRRLFQGTDEIPRWQKKRCLPEVQRYVAAEHEDGVTFHSGGWADLTPWLAHHLEHPAAGITVVATKWDFGPAINLNDGARTIFATGYTPSSSSPTASAFALPWKPAKGELLTVRIPGLNLQEILLRGIFVIPLHRGKTTDFYRVGATYEWTDLNSRCTAAGQKFLTDKLESLISLPYEIVDVQAAIRPILQDARPVVGMFKNQPQIGICTGFGSKAALLTPAITRHFADHLVNGTALDPEINLERLVNNP